ncbi:MAG: DinB family protein [Anaerolineae bacterium]|nr:DinB family protein [Phycisphaerae bacterium]
MNNRATRQTLLAEMVRQSRDLLHRYLRGFDHCNHTHQARSLPNHLAWTLGHLAITMHRTAERIDGQPLPATDFLTGDGRSGDANHFDTESVSFGSKPIADSRMYPLWPRCVAICDAAVERLVRAIETADDAKLDLKTKWGNTEVPLYTLAGRMVFHNSTHTGQIADLRRALGMGTILA